MTANAATATQLHFFESRRGARDAQTIYPIGIEGDNNYSVVVYLSDRQPDPFFVAARIVAPGFGHLTAKQEAILRCLGVVNPTVSEVDIPNALWGRFRTHLAGLGAPLAV